MIWFTGCTHLGHTNIIKHCNRPFSNVEEMDATIIQNTNELVGPNDILCHLGDVAWNKPALRNYLSKLKVGNLHLILGNHDNKSDFYDYEKNYKVKILNLGYMHEMKNDYIPATTIVLCHYPLLEWNRSHYGSIHLYSHSHGRLNHPNPRAIDVSVDAWDFKPVSLTKINNKIYEKCNAG